MILILICLWIVFCIVSDKSSVDKENVMNGNKIPTVDIYGNSNVVNKKITNTFSTAAKTFLWLLFMPFIFVFLCGMAYNNNDFWWFIRAPIWTIVIVSFIIWLLFKI